MLQIIGRVERHEVSQKVLVGGSYNQPSVHLFFFVVFSTGPRGLRAPTLSSRTSRTVMIEWESPSEPNGILQKYVVQRRLLIGGNVGDVGEVNASVRKYTDNTVRPVTAYAYRIIAYSAVRGEPSPYSNITTGQGGMWKNSFI